MTATVAVVGAGLAGLACADRLRRAGVPATLYEASDRVGGRCWTLRGHFATGRHVERGAQLIDSGHSTLLALARELELELIDVQAAEPPGTMPALFVGGAPYLLHHAFADFAQVQPVNPRRPRRGRAAHRLPAPEAARPPARPAVGHRVRRPGRARRPAVPARPAADDRDTWELGADFDESSALHLIDLLGCNGPGEFQLLGPADAAYTVRDGCDRLATGLAARAPAAIQLGHELVAVRQRAGGRVSLTFADGWATREVVADKVVLALPFSILRGSVDTSQAGFGPRKHTAIQSLGMVASARLHLQFDGRPWQAQAYHGRVGQRYRLSELLGRDAGPLAARTRSWSVSRRGGRSPTPRDGPRAGDGLSASAEATTATPAGSSTRSRRCSPVRRRAGTGWRPTTTGRATGGH